MCNLFVYLAVWGAFPIDDAVVHHGHLVPHGNIGVGQRVRDGHVQEVASGSQVHSGRRAQGS